jgi:hypothetical protein
MMSIIHCLRKAKGTNKKLEILKQHSNNAQWLRFLRYVYESHRNYYVSSVTDMTFVQDDDNDFDAMFNCLDMMQAREFTGNKARDFAKRYSMEFGAAFRLVLNRSINAGVSTTTINKAYPGLIHTFDIMKGKDIPVTRFPILSSIKYDGIRLLAFVYEKQEVILRTSSGKEIQIDSLIADFKKLPVGVYDCELIKGDGLQADRTGITGQVNKILLGTATDLEDYSCMVFDVISHYEWEAKTSTTQYILRYQEVNDLNLPIGNIRQVDQKELNSLEEIEVEFELILSLGFEGLILRYADDVYHWSRVDTLIKKKAIKECVLRCIEVLLGRGKYEGLIGALRCVGFVDGKEVTVKPGSGLSDFDRNRDPSYYLDRDVEIMYNTIIQGEHADHYSLFLPRVKRVKGDNDV